MKPETIIKKLDGNKAVFEHLLINSTAREYTFKLDANAWCLLEVVSHLLDEEVEDFRARINHVLTTPHLPLKPITPDKWPKERNYLQKDFDATLKGFLTERQKSIDWFSSLKEPNWAQTIDHPEVGPRSAKMFLVNWLAHDYHHIRQINRIHHAYLMSSSNDDLTYAGKW